MNDLVKTEPQDAAVTQLLTIKPETYVAEVFKPFKKELTAAVRAASKTPDYDITTTAGMAVAKQLRASFRTIRTTAENVRKERKAPIIEIGKLLDTRYKELEAEIKPHEDKYDAQVKAEEERKERIKQEELAKERARIEAIENRLANIRNLPGRYLQSDSATIAKAIDEQSTLVLDPADYDEFHEDAINAVNAVLVQLEAMRKAAAQREEEARRIEAERAELARLKAEREAEEKQRAEEERKRQEEEASRRAEAEAAAAAQARRIAELEAQLAAARAPKEEEKAPVETLQMGTGMVEVQLNPGFTPGVAVMTGAEGSAVAIDGLPIAGADDPEPPRQLPTKGEILEVLAAHYGENCSTVAYWLTTMDFSTEL